VPVLALLPGPSGYRIEQLGEGINEPFRDRPGHHEPADWGLLRSPAVWGPLLIVLGAALLYVLPTGWMAGLQLPSSATGASAPQPAAAVSSSSLTQDAASAGAAPASASVQMAAPSVSSAASAAPAFASGAEAGAASAAVAPMAVASAVGDAGNSLELRARADSWIEVQDARSQVLMSGLLRAGEAVVLDGQPPLRLKVGNARAMHVVFRGNIQDLASSTTDNVARLELK